VRGSVRARPIKHYGKWRIRWRDALGRNRSESHPTYEAADAALHRHLSEKELQQHGRAGALADIKTFGDLCDAWIKYRVPQKRSGKDDRSMIRRHLRPSLGAYRLSVLQLEHLEAFRATLQLAPKTVSNILTLLNSILKYATDLGWCDRVPKIKKPKLTDTTADYRYLRTAHEIERFLAAAAAEGPLVEALYATAVYTGMRAGELAGLRWDCVDLEPRSRLITVRRSYAGPTKNGEIRRVPIVDALLPILKAWRLQCPGDLVFPTAKGTLRQGSDRSFQEVLQRVFHAAK
jgi:integrase